MIWATTFEHIARTNANGAAASVSIAQAVAKSSQSEYPQFCCLASDAKSADIWTGGYGVAMPADQLSQIRAAMRDAGVSQAELARRCGTSAPAISDVFAYKRSPTMGLLQRMMDSLNLEVTVSVKRKERCDVNQ